MLKRLTLPLAAGLLALVGACSSDPGTPPSPDTSPTATTTTPPPPTTPPHPSSDGGAPDAARPPAPPQPAGGVLLDAYGGIHPFGGVKLDTTGAPYWKDLDIARALVVLADGSGGYVLDGYGAIHNFGTAPAIASPVPTPGKDNARALVVLSDLKSGYVLDSHGAVTAFGPSAPALANTTSWNWDIARGLDIHYSAAGVPDGGWILDGWGGLHKFGAAPDIGTAPYYASYDVWYKLHVVKGGAYLIGRWGIIEPMGTPAGIPLTNLPDWNQNDVVRDIVPVSATGTFDGARALDCPVAGTYCGFDGIRGGTNVLYRCGGTGGAPAEATVCGKGCKVMPAGVPDYCVGALSCANQQWWNTALTYGPYQNYGWWDTDLAVSSSTKVQLRHDSKLTKTGVYGWGYMPEFTDMVTGKQFRFLHLRPQNQYATAVGTVYPAGTIVGLSGGDTADTGLGTYSTGAHLCVQTIEDYRVVFPTGQDPCE